VTISGDDALAGTDYGSIGIESSNVSNVVFYGDTIIGSSGRLGIGIDLVGLPGSSTYAVGFDVVSANIGNLQYGILYGSYVQGLQLNSSNLIGNQYGLLAPTADTGGNTSALIQGNNLDNTVADILFQTNVGGTTISGNAFFANFASVNGFSGICVSCSFTGNTFLSTTTTGTCGICLISGGTNNIIVGNLFQGFSVGVSLASGANNNNVQSNAYNSNTTNTSNSGTGNTIGGGSP
jgi:hypothetical protein